MTMAAMPQQAGLPAPAAPVDAEGEREMIETRFGPMEFARDQALYMPRGILGFAEHKNFGLAYLPNRFIDRLMLLQSLSNADTSFLVLPIGIDSGIIEERDLAAACNTMVIDPDNAVVALIVTIRDVGGEPQVTVNLRAPILLDAGTRTGWQYVLPNARYSVRQPLNLDAPASASDGEN